MGTPLALIVFLLIGWRADVSNKKRRAKLTPEERQREDEEFYVQLAMVTARVFAMIRRRASHSSSAA